LFKITQVPGRRDHGQPGTGYLCRHHLRVGEGRGVVFLADYHQSWAGERAEMGDGIGAVRHGHQIDEDAAHRCVPDCAPDVINEFRFLLQ
jgi:hypothetical protein